MRFRCHNKHSIDWICLLFSPSVSTTFDLSLLLISIVFCVIRLMDFNVFYCVTCRLMCSWFCSFFFSRALSSNSYTVSQACETLYFAYLYIFFIHYTVRRTSFVVSFFFSASIIPCVCMFLVTIFLSMHVFNDTSKRKKWREVEEEEEKMMRQVVRGGNGRSYTLFSNWWIEMISHWKYVRLSNKTMCIYLSY